MSKKPESTSDVLSVQQAADRLGVTHYTIRDRIADGQLPAYRLGAAPGAAIRIKISDVDALLQRIEIDT